METFLDVSVEAYNLTAVRWPANGHFMAPSWMARTRPLTFWRMVLQLFNGTTPEERDANGVPRDITTPDTMLVHNRLAMLHLAHVFERLWFAVFDRRYAPKLRAIMDAQAAGDKPP